MRHLLILFILTLCFSNASYANSGSINVESSISDSLIVDHEAYLRDLDSLKAWVEALHPLPYARISEDDFNIALNLAKEEVLKLDNEKDFIYIVSALLGKIRDSHTGISIGVLFKKTLEQNWKANAFLPKVINIEDELYVIQDGSGLLSSGYKITTLNGVASQDVFKSALALSPWEGNSWLSNFRAAERLTILTTLYNSEDSSELFINGEKYSLMERGNNKSKQFTGLHWEIEDNIARLSIWTFGSDSDRKYSKALKKGFKELNKSSRKGESQCLVIDLRGNTGGYLDRMLEIFEYLPCEEDVILNSYIFRKSPETGEEVSQFYKGIYKKIVEKWSDAYQGFRQMRKVAELEVGKVDTLFFDKREIKKVEKWKGQTILLIDGLSASASVSFASFFKDLELGPILGEPCMGPKSGTFGDPVTRVLPGSRISIDISTSRMVLYDDYSIGNRSIQPSRWVQRNVDDLVNKIDPLDNAIQDCISFPEVGKEALLSSRESKIMWTELDKMFSTERLWGGEVRASVWSKILISDKCISEQKNRMKGAELIALRAAQAEIKDCKASRDIAIKVILPSSLREVFEEISSPNRPAVLHFGLHNRADCNVCKPN